MVTSGAAYIRGSDMCVCAVRVRQKSIQCRVAVLQWKQGVLKGTVFALNKRLGWIHDQSEAMIGKTKSTGVPELTPQAKEELGIGTEVMVITELKVRTPEKQVLGTDMLLV